MAAKTEAEPRAKGRQSRRREIVGILLMAGGLFTGLSLLSMQAGNNRMMGPGGAATAAALYAVGGFGSYLVIAAMLIACVRCFRAKPLVDGFGEGVGALLLLCSMTVLLHLPFADSLTSHHGPGGLLGQWLGEVTASFIGAAGAALAAATVFFVALMLVSDVSAREVTVVVAWAVRQARRGIWGALTTTWALAKAAFPERVDESAAGDDEFDERGRDIKVIGPEAKRLARFESEAQQDDRVHLDEAEEGTPTSLQPETSDAIRIGEARALSEEIADERAAMAAIVAEVAAVEKVARPPEAVERPAISDGFESETEIGDGDVDSETESDQSTALAVIAAPSVVEGPIIVEPAWRTRQRLEQEAADAALERPRAVEADGPGFIKLSEGAFQLPGTELLEYIPPQAHDTDKQALYDMAERLEQAMSNYGVRGKVKEIHMGPVVTMYEFAPAPGTRTGKIANLEKDLAMALEAQAVRIVAPIPGKAVVGVEVPNQTRETVYLKEILEDACFTGANSKLQVGIGKDIKGAPVSVNLSKMPHLLVAGTTGSGKSVAVNGMITSLLYNASPEEVRFIMVDPKMLELSIYEGIPHLLLPVVTDPKKANLALRWAVEEMERRYELLSKTGVRDIASYNSKIDQANKGVPTAVEKSSSKKIKVVLAGADGTEQEIELDGDGDGAVQSEVPSEEDLSDIAAATQAAAEKAAANPPPRKLPYIVIVIDEFADLMMVAPKDVETSVARIAQKARAAGLHLILATQRPSVDVITGLIKANFPSRIALQVASKIDSRTILDQSGAETLLGNGDMLFSDRGTKLRRLHGAFLSDDEVHRVVDFLKKQAKPVYDMDILKPREEDAEDGAPASDFNDELYDQAIAIVCETRQASVSFIQRRLQIGYNRAARMVEQMERDGIVGAANGAKPREIIAPPGEYLQHAP
jgi:S-DNA-T family DNA segregation ATPase FtsK/SpoIIIE